MRSDLVQKDLAQTVEPSSTELRLFETIPGNNVYLLADPPRFTILAVTNSYLQITGKSRNELIGKGMFDVFPANPDDPTDTGENDLRASLKQVIAQRAKQDLPVQRYDVSSADGSFVERYWKASNLPLLNDDGTVTCIIHTADDITDWVKAEQSEDKIKGLEQAHSLFMQAPISIHMIKGLDLIIEMANAPTLQYWGRGTEVVGLPLMEALPELEGQGYDVFLREVLRTGETKEFYETPVTLQRNGKKEVGYFNFIYKPYYEEGSDKPVGIVTVSTEVTDKVLAKKELAEQRQRLELAMQIGGLADFKIDVATQTATYSQQLMEWFDLSEPASSVEAISCKVHPEDRPFVQKTLERSIAGEWDGRHDFTYRLPHKNGNLLYLRSIGQVQWENGNPVSIFGIIQDVTGQVTSRNQIEQSELALRNTILQAPVAMCIFRGPDHVVEIANERMFEFWGRGGEEVLNKPIFEGMPEVKDQGYEDLLHSVFTTGERFSAQGISVRVPRNGRVETACVNLLYEALREGNGTITGVIAVAVDVTEQVQARRKLEESERALRSFILQAPIAIAILRSREYVVEIVNVHALEFWGRTSEEVMNRPLFDCLPELRTQGFREFFDNIYDTGVPVALTEHPIEFVRNGKLDKFYFNFLYEVLHDADGKINGLMAVGVDVTLQTMARMKIEEAVAERTKELAAANEALQSTNKELQRSNQNLEEFAHAASHDLKEPIRKIHFFTSQLKEQLRAQLKEAETRSFSRIENATERMGNLIDDLLLYSHVSQRPHQTETIDLNQKVQHVLEDLELDIEEKKAAAHIGKLPVVKGYTRQLQQLFQNLISNALKYSKAGVPPQIYISASVSNEGGKLYHVIKVADNGIGFEQEYADKIFQMFTRLHGKGEYSGTGVGLSIVKKVVENHNGFIRVESVPGKGSTFQVYLPIE